MFSVLRLAYSAPLALILAIPCAGDSGWEEAVQRGKALCDRGRYSEAEAVLVQAIERGAQEGAGVEWIAAAWNNLGAVRQSLGKHSEAERCYRNAVSLWDKIPDRSLGGIVSFPLVNLGRLYVCQHRYGDADKAYRRALGIRIEAHGRDHEEVGSVLQHLGGLERLRGHHAAAEALLVEARAICERRRGPEAIEVAQCLYQLGLIAAARNELAQAASALERASAIWQRSLGPDHPDLAFGLAHLAEVYARSGRSRDAGELYARAVQILERRMPENPDTAWVLSGYARLLRSTERKRDAAALERRAAWIRAKYTSENALRHRVDMSELGP